MLLEELTMPQVEAALAAGCRTVYIPFGALEEHGPHLPLSTDTIQAYQVGKRAAELIPLFVAPPIPYGNCRSTNCHPGTVSISTTTLRGLLKDLVRSFYRQGMRNVVVLTGHAGDWMYRDGAGSSMPPEMLDKGDDFFRGRQVVVMLCHPGNTTFFSTMPDAALRSLKATAPLLTFDGGNWRNLQAEPAIGSAAFEIQPDGLLKVNPRKAGAAVGDGGKWVIALTPELKKYRALQLTFNFKSHYHFYISADAGAGETFRDLPKDGPLRATMPVRLNEQSRELTVFFPRVFSHPKVMPLIKSLQISGLE